MIAKESIQQLKERIDIVDIIGDYVELKRAGSLYKGLSPFVEEKSPSFTVSPSKNMWFDFSTADKGGDVIKFVMEYESLNFEEAVEKLADRIGFTLKYEAGVKKTDTKVLESYNKWLMQNLMGNSNALNYLNERGISFDTIKKFEIGYAPSSKDTIEFLKSGFHNIEEAVELGIVDNGDRGLYARFIERIMFPIRTHSGAITGFSGRTISNHPAKYVNTKETPVFKKSRQIFGINLAKDSIVKQDYFILSEGQMDVAMQHQHGVTNSVATMGTAVSDSHIKILKRFSSRCIIAYDGDRAGVSAAFKAAEICTKNGVEAKVVLFDDGMDPADILLSKGKAEFRKYLTGGVDAISFMVDKKISEYDISSPVQLENAVSDIKKFSSEFSEIIAESIIRKASSKINFTISTPQRPRSVVSTTSNANYAELSILKRALIDSNEEVIDEVIASEKCFSRKDIIDDVKAGNFESEKISWLLLNKDITPSVDVYYDLIVFKLWCIDMYIKRISVSQTFNKRDRVIKLREAQAKKIELQEKLIRR